MSDESSDQSATPAPQPVIIKQGRGCLATLVGSALTIVVSAALGAALAIAFMWYGPRNIGMTFPDSTGRMGALEAGQQTTVVFQADAAATLRSLSDIRGSVDSLRESVQTIETSINTRETNLDNLQKQIDSNLTSLLAIQKRLDELESIPANAALSQKIADVEVELATVGTTLERLRTALGAPSATNPPAPQPTASAPTPTP